MKIRISPNDWLAEQRRDNLKMAGHAVAYLNVYNT